MSKQRLEGKVAIVTGAASGIGAEAVKIFVENGAFVVIADINDELGHQLATSIGLDKVSYHHCDVREEKQVEEIVAFTLERYGTLDIMFSNAAATIKHASRVMVERKIRGSIICTASVAGFVGRCAGHDYTASKHGLIGLVRSACGELGAYGIRVNSISPYAVATPLACRALDMVPSEVEAVGLDYANLQGITLKAAHIAETALFLASDESAYISGHNLVVDGGFSVINRCLPSIKKQ
ncbi:short-chain dehydrogenase reductase 3a isoform X2 [Medicago truncatula]|uniref:short-chain dehydrogenase reductase 3a isoform X2 n=1 Tax=Medicago truncatula TaxID=3880 RepID=UPI0019675FCC|nr:short-chain dehydrogenase reductase 3a isoform X2 [Medicago truncatula]